MFCVKNMGTIFADSNTMFVNIVITIATNWLESVQNLIFRLKILLEVKVKKIHIICTKALKKGETIQRGKSYKGGY